MGSFWGLKDGTSDPGYDLGWISGFLGRQNGFILGLEMDCVGSKAKCVGFCISATFTVVIHVTTHTQYIPTQICCAHVCWMSCRRVGISCGNLSLPLVG